MSNPAVLNQRARFAIFACWVVAFFTIPIAFGELASMAGLIDLDAVDLDPLALAYSMVALAYLIAFFASVVFICLWIHRAHQALADAGYEGLEYTPGWAVGWYFIPLANLVKPFGAMKELWKVSHREPVDGEVGTGGRLTLWWGTWISGNILTSISSRMMESESAGILQASYILGFVGYSASFVSALLLARIIRSITDAQDSGAMNAQIFT